VSEELTRAVALNEVTGPVLQRMAARMGMLRGTITILNRANGAIVIEDAFGLSPHEMERGRYALGEGITGKVIATGEPAVVPDVVDEPLFLDRTRARRRNRSNESGTISFICVPIINGKEVVGALSVDRLSHDEVSLEEDVRLLTIIASMIAQAVRMRQAAREQYESLERENARLHSELAQRFRPANIIGNSAAMARVLAEIAQVAGSPTTAWSPSASTTTAHAPTSPLCA
jgi:Nif-specific regulatory protein